MLSFPLSVQCRDTPAFSRTFKSEFSQQDLSQLPLQQSMQHGSQLGDAPFQVMVLASQQSEQILIVRAGIFFESVIAGCNCSDDPSSADVSYHEYAELQFSIDLQSSLATVEQIA